MHGLRGRGRAALVGATFERVAPPGPCDERRPGLAALPGPPDNFHHITLEILEREPKGSAKGSLKICN